MPMTKRVSFRADTKEEKKSQKDLKKLEKDERKEFKKGIKPITTTSNAATDFNSDIGKDLSSAKGFELDKSALYNLKSTNGSTEIFADLTRN